VKFRNILLTGTDVETGTVPAKPGRMVSPTLSNFRFIRERPFAILSFHQKCRPGALPPLVGALLVCTLRHSQS